MTAPTPLTGVAEQVKALADEWMPKIKAFNDSVRTPPCCDLHGRNCEQVGEECCHACTEAHHFDIGHGGVPCSSPDLSKESN